MINTTSLAHFFGSSFFGPGLEFDTFKDGPKQRRKGKLWLYGQSKFVRHLLGDHERKHDDLVISFSLNRPMWYSLKSWSEGMEMRSFRLQSTQV